MKLVPLASGSSGNSYFVQSNGAAVLVDAGLNAKQICLRMEAAGIDPGILQAIVLSHAHSDHVKGAGVLSRKFKIPVWTNEGTWAACPTMLGAPHEVRFFRTGRIFECAGLKIHPFSVPHDCADPVGFRISYGARRLGIATDLGIATGLVVNSLRGLEVVVLESNHDPKMLMDGPYPWELKHRVKGRSGHLSNEDSAKLLSELVNDQMLAVVLAHLSETNNLPELAHAGAEQALGEFVARRGRLMCAAQHTVGPIIEW